MWESCRDKRAVKEEIRIPLWSAATSSALCALFAWPRARVHPTEAGKHSGGDADMLASGTSGENIQQEQQQNGGGF